MTSFKLGTDFGEPSSSFRSFWGGGTLNLLGEGARRGFEDFEVSVGRATGFNFGFDGVEGVEVGLGIEEVTGVLALGRGIESEDITRGRGLLGSMVDDGQVVGGNKCRKTAARMDMIDLEPSRSLYYVIYFQGILQYASHFPWQLFFPPNCSPALLWL